VRRRLWYPQLRVEGKKAEERHATWLELFYDLIFVVTIAQLANNLHNDVSLRGVLQFVGLFIPVWWAWIGQTFYATRFDTDDLGHRLLTILTMFGVAILAVNVPDGFTENAPGFALSYAFVRTLLVLEYLWAGRHIPAARPLTNRYSVGFGIAAMLWIASAFVPAPLRYLFWALGLAIDIGTPLTAGMLHARIPPHISHLPERFGLFTIIVLGEAIVAVVTGISKQDLEPHAALSGLFGLSIAFSLWWVYFNAENNASPWEALSAGQVRTYQVWLYSHLPLVIGITAAAIGVKHVISPGMGGILTPEDRWLLCVSVAVCLCCLALIHLASTTTITAPRRKVRAVWRFATAGAILVLGAAGGALPPAALIGMIAAACVAQVVADLRQGCS
jgi:low temperature requirement protein LtrA